MCVCVCVLCADLSPEIYGLKCGFSKLPCKCTLLRSTRCLVYFASICHQLELECYTCQHQMEKAFIMKVKCIFCKHYFTSFICYPFIFSVSSKVVQMFSSYISKCYSPSIAHDLIRCGVVRYDVTWHNMGAGYRHKSDIVTK